MKSWLRKDYEVLEKKFDYDLHEFEIIQMGEVVATITPHSFGEMNEIIECLDNGDDVNGWEDGMGNTINVKKLNGILVKNNAFDAVLLGNGTYMEVDSDILIEYLANPGLDDWVGKGGNNWDGVNIENAANEFGDIIAYYLDDELIVVDKEKLEEMKALYLGE